MFPPKKILFAVDFSDAGAAMAAQVRELALQSGAEVDLLHVLEPDPQLPYTAKAEQARRKLETLISRNLQDCNLVVHLTPGDPSATIVSVAAKGGADLIMMPTHGYGAFRRSLLGSVTARVLHNAGCPVWTSAHPSTLPAYRRHGVKTILCAVDFGSRSAPALDAAIHAAQFWDAEFRLAHVAELSQGPARADWTEQDRRGIVAAIEDQLRRMVDGKAPAPIVEVLSGSPVPEIAAAAERCHADLVVMGRTSVLETEQRLGSTAYGVIARSHCPVLSV
jgi:nucleotide-binding universal stress UspA family protein